MVLNISEDIIYTGSIQINLLHVLTCNSFQTQPKGPL